MWGTRHNPSGATQADDAHHLRAAQHDLTQFAPVYERYVDRIYAYCRHRVGEQDAEDVTSHIFVRAMGGVDGYRGGSVAAWLFRIAHNCVVDHLRYRRPQILRPVLGRGCPGNRDNLKNRRHRPPGAVSE